LNNAARRATPDDLERIVELAGELRGELEPMRGGRLATGREMRPEPYAPQFAAILERDDACAIVGTIDDYVVGFGVVELETLRDGEILGRVTELFVELPARGVGVGEAIAVELVAYCDAADCMGMDALALPGHRATKNFFEASGFTARALIMHRPRGGRP
jgi:GNAT superfamily N-acetyltransferase